MIIVDIIGSLAVPHILAFFLISRLGMFEVRPDKSNTFREDMALLWAWTRPRWRRMAAHPLYWAATGIVSAYFLVEPLRRLFL
jgi:hypothetical protein